MSDNRNFKVLNDREHVLLRPQMYIGGVNATDKEQWIYNKKENKFKYGIVKFVPALLKCASELVDNSIDVAIDTNFKKATKIKVNVDDKSIEVIDDGIGIPCEPPKGSTDKNPEGTCACVAWTTLKSGTSFGDDRKKIGTNGVGSSCVNIFSKLFIGESDDGKHSQRIKCVDNMSKISAGQIKNSSGHSGVKVYCEPDLERFGLKEIDQTHKDLIYQRLVTLSICFPKISFYFNGEKINLSNKKFATMFSENAEIVSIDNATIIVFPNEHDDFKFYSAVNGVDTCRGGSHIDQVVYEVTSRIRDKLVRKYKSIRPGDVKNKIALVTFLTDFKNPQFDSQTKESLSNANADVTAHFGGKIDWEKFTKQILKNNSIIDPIVETFKIKEELKARQELKKIKRVKVKSDKYMAPIGEHKYLTLCEGLSARGGVSMALGRKGIAYYAMRGLPLNGYSSSIQKITANQEIKDVINILGLDLTSKEEHKSIDFEKILIATDADADGSHITSMIIGWFKRFAPNLFNENKICKLVTPLVLIEDKNQKIKNYFFSLQEFKSWESKNSIPKGCNVKYLKGLGSWETSQLVELIDKNGFDNFVKAYKLDDKADTYIEDWLGNDAEPRKKYLREFSFDINQA